MINYIKKLIFVSENISDYGADGCRLTFKDWKKMLFMLESCGLSQEKKQLLKKYVSIFKTTCAGCGHRSNLKGLLLCRDLYLGPMFGRENFEHLVCEKCWSHVKKGLGGK